MDCQSRELTVDHKRRAFLVSRTLGKHGLEPDAAVEQRYSRLELAIWQTLVTRGNALLSKQRLEFHSQ